MDKAEFLKLTEYFVRLVRRGADPARAGEPVPVKPEEITWEQVYMFADKHSLSVAVFRALQAENNPTENRPQKELWEKWEHVCRVQVMADIQQLYAWEEMSAYFSEKGLKLLPLKGVHVKNLYTETAARQMGDIDVLYEKERFPEVRAAMEELGFVYDKKTENYHHQVFNRAPVTEVELHRELLWSDAFFSGYYDTPWDRAIPTETPYIYRFSREDEYIFLLIHAALHFMGSGSGVRTAMDFYLYRKKYGEELDRAYIDAEIAKADEIARKNGQEEDPLAEFEKTVISIAEGWFRDEEVHTDEAGLAMASNGVYGKSEHLWKKNYEKQGKTYFLRRFFPTYAYLKKTNPILNKAPYLLPFVWIKRIVCGIIFRGKKLWAEYKYIKAEKRRKKAEEKRKK